MAQFHIGERESHSDYRKWGCLLQGQDLSDMFMSSPRATFAVKVIAYTGTSHIPPAPNTPKKVQTEDL